MPNFHATSRPIGNNGDASPRLHALKLCVPQPTTITLVHIALYTVQFDAILSENRAMVFDAAIRLSWLAVDTTDQIAITLKNVRWT